MSLSDLIKDSTVKASIIEDCNQLIDAHVSQKGGMSGIALKTAYRVVKGIGPSYVQGAIGRLLPDVLTALEPIWQEGMAINSPAQHLIQQRSRTANLILSVTDARIERSSGPIVSAYNKLRKSVQSDIEAVVPDLASILERHYSPTLQNA
ncbi:MAG: hypothetical protein ACFB0E_16795 [Leptolyngbyaceae cyanobacterium]